ncbi:uncharacterized protein METZ01_LOCUS127532 [marine metagenome]|uniref:Uncharacterized protein n=1 Tax=marine metagenome TaxID=408172 RepID=A0A381YCC4_9ZZZZ
MIPKEGNNSQMIFSNLIRIKYQENLFY